MHAALTIRRRLRQMKKSQESERGVTSGNSDHESDRVGMSRRKKRRKECKHDPWAQDLAQVLLGAYHWLMEPTTISSSLGNGLEGTSWSKFCEQETTILLGMMVFRFFNFLVVQTYYVPDEYWQSLEVAHHQAFGDGYITWEWTAKIRSYLYPAIFTLLYKLADLLSLDSYTILTKLPRLLQAMFYALGDLYLYKLSSKLAGPLVGQWTLLCNCLNWFIFYCSTRTLTNTAETTLVVIAIYYYPWTKASEKFGDSWKFLWTAAIAVMIRPTCGILWLPLCSCHLWKLRREFKKIFVLYGITILLFGFIMVRIDKAIYNEWTLVPLNFFIFNISRSISHFYGTHGFWWYFTQGLPFILSAHLILVVLGWKSCKNRSVQVLLIWTTCVYSFLAHKEFRFVLPILPLFMHICGYYVTVTHQQIMKVDRLNQKKLEVITEEQVSQQLSALKAAKSAQKSGERDSGLTTTSELSDSISDSEIIKAVKRKQEKQKPAYPLITPRLLVTLLIIGNIPMMLYFSVIHQRGALDVVQYLHLEALSGRNMSVLFLMPCHSTPYYSHIHSNITMRFLTCEPNIYNKTGYVDEAERFYEDPIRWLKTEVVKGSNKHVYSHVVMFDSLEMSVSKFLKKGSYTQGANYFFTHIPVNRRHSKYVKVFKRPAKLP